VAGGAVAGPGDVVVRVGTGIRDLIEFCGGYAQGRPGKLIAGGVTYVASANELSGRLLASAAFEPEVATLVEDITTGARGGYDLQQYQAGQELGNRRVIDVRDKLHAVAGPLLIAVAKLAGDRYDLLPHPSPELHVDESDQLIVLGNRDQAQRLVERYHVQQGR